MRIRRVLIGLDLHPSFAHVATIANTLAGRVSAGITYVCAHPTLAVAKSRERDAVLEPLRRRGIIRGDVLFRSDLGASAMLDEAGTLGADLIVVGSGARGHGPDLAGATRDIIRNLAVPAVIVPTHGRALERSEVDAMVAPVDFALDGDDALACTRELGQQLGTRIVLMHSAETRAALSDASVAGRVGRRLKDGLYALAVQGMRAFMGLATPLRTVERMVRLSELPVLILPPAWLAAHSPLLPTPLK